MTEIPTVRIKADTPLGYAIINATDYAPGEHELIDAPDPDALTFGANDLVPQENVTGNITSDNGSPELEEVTGGSGHENLGRPQPEPKPRKRRNPVSE